MLSWDMPLELTVGRLALGAGIALIVYLLLLAVGRYFKRRHGVRFGLAYQLFSLLAALQLPVWLLRIRHPLERELLGAGLLLGAWAGVLFLRRFVWERYFRQDGRPRVPRMLREVASVVLLLVTLLFVLTQIYGLEIPGLLAGSGIVAIVLGLAMQDLLSNIIAGFALHFEKPFRLGDWLSYNGQYAEVMEVNWRSTRLRTTDDIYLDIPNRELAHQTIVNLCYPNARHAMRLVIGVEHEAPPSRVKDALARAASGADGVLADPAPKVFLTNFGNHAVEYEIKFWIEDQSKYNVITDAIRTNSWYELRRAGCKIPVSPATVQLERARPRTRQTDPEAVRELLLALPLFQSIDEFERETLLNGSRSLWFGRGEHILRQHEAGESMFALVQGSASVVVDAGHGPKQVAVLRAGDCFGEMSLLTGEPRTATLVAREDCETVEITKDAMKVVLQHNPALSRRLGQLLAQRQLETEGVLDAAEPDPAAAETRRAEYEEGFLKKVQAFFEL